ncbi:MAG TPA: RimK family alpha-L-glutamate ligase, partial [Clostridia bacterium]|nr:RimK family alpha-L-glutamate ligase [Clostridia bacterium]
LFGYPIIVKGSYGSMGQSVFKADCRAGLLELMERLKRKAHLFQKCVTSSIGKDMRIIVIGGRARAAMLRESKSDFRSNIELGASGIAVEPAPDFERAAEAAARVLGLDFCGVDVLFGENGEPIVCEVNSNAFFGGIEAATGKNIAREYAEYILSDLKEKR